MKKIKIFLFMVAAVSFLVNPMVLPVQSANESAKIKLRSGTYEVTKKQVEDLKKQPGIQFSKDLPPSLPKKEIVVAIPDELGGGYIIGTGEAIASAFNTVGITTGLTAAAVTGVTGIGAGIIAATLAGVIAASFSGRGTAAHHHAAAHH